MQLIMIFGIQFLVKTQLTYVAMCTNLPSQILVVLDSVMELNRSNNIAEWARARNSSSFIISPEEYGVMDYIEPEV